MYRLNYYPWLTQNVPPEEIARQVRAFAEEVSKALAALGASDSAITVLPPVDVPQQIVDIIQADAQIALMNPLGFAFARRRSGQVEAIAVAQRIIDGTVGDSYFAQLYTRADSDVTDMPGCRGKSIGYGVPYSTSNFLVPAHLLFKVGVHPLLGFRNVQFLQGHELVARAVYAGQVAVGAGHDGVIIDLAKQKGFEDAPKVLKQIKRSPPIPSDPLVVNIQDASERSMLQQALIDASRTEAGKAALKIFWGNTQGLAATESSVYQPLLAAMDDLKLTEADILPGR
jgi:phosphonate transport system substrate-binding protein